MKKHSVSLFVLLLAISTLLTACDGNKKKSLRLEFTTANANETIYLFADTTKPGANLQIDFTYIQKASDARVKDTLNGLFQQLCLGDDYRTMQPQEAVERYKEAYAADYRKLEPMYSKDREEKESNATMESWYSYYRTVKGSLCFQNDALLVYRTDETEYTGGAHGTSLSRFYNISLAKLRPLHLADLFIDDYKAPLTDLLWNQLMADNHVKSRAELEDMGYGTSGELEPLENFAIDATGITFYYNVYEIAPYVMGLIKISLPYEAIAPLLKEGVREQYSL
ncbi:MAG: DUF3298 and DUF4163 domain-containing protein [Prevotellaceae bacterium]|jgi:hypothetical protein|nr:DUF3298 and DUF4163 domain-containing protein [Prevotellaceae bacterium]